MHQGVCRRLVDVETDCRYGLGLAVIHNGLTVADASEAWTHQYVRTKKPSLGVATQPARDRGES